MKISLTTKFFIALILGLVSVFVIDPLDPSTVSTPFCLGILLMAISLRQPTSLVIAVSLLYAALTMYALIIFHQYHEAHVPVVAPHPYFWLFQRVGLFIVLCGMAIYLSYYRTDTERILTRLRTILGKLPTPVILSDVSGNVVYANDAVIPILRLNPAEIIGRSYFDFFLTDQTKGKSIRSYFELFETETNEMHEIGVTLIGDKTVTAQLICLGSGLNRILITVLQVSEKIAAQPGVAQASLTASFETGRLKL